MQNKARRKKKRKQERFETISKLPCLHHARNAPTSSYSAHRLPPGGALIQNGGGPPSPPPLSAILQTLATPRTQKHKEQKTRAQQLSPIHTSRQTYQTTTIIITYTKNRSSGRFTQCRGIHTDFIPWGIFLPRPSIPPLLLSLLRPPVASLWMASRLLAIHSRPVA